MLTLIDEFTRECLAIDVSRRMTSEDVLIERWRIHDNTVRLPNSLGYRPHAHEAVLPASQSIQTTT